MNVLASLKRARRLLGCGGNIPEVKQLRDILHLERLPEEVLVLGERGEEGVLYTLKPGAKNLLEDALARGKKIELFYEALGYSPKDLKEVGVESGEFCVVFTTQSLGLFPSSVRWS